jgi:LAO/AO transport system kinase
VKAMQSLATRQDRWVPPTVQTVASEARGVNDLAAAIAKYEEFLTTNGLLRAKKVESWRERLIAMLRDSLLERVVRAHMDDGNVARYATEIVEHKRDPYALVEEIVERLKGI